MTPKEIFDDYLAVGKTLSLAFPSLIEAQKFLSHLRTIKYRAENYSAKFGFTTGTESLRFAVQMRNSELGGVVLSISLAEKPKPKLSYTILSIDDTSEQEGEQTNEILPADLGKDKS